MFNSLRYAKQLEDVGYSRQQAEVHVQIMTEIMESTFATKQDMKDLGTSLRAEMKELDATLRHEMALLKSELVIKLGTIVSIAIGVAVALARVV